MGSGLIGSEFLPHLDEGAIWARATLAPSTGPTEGTAVMNRARVVIASFPEVRQVVSQVGRPDDGTDTTGFFNTEYFIDLKPKEEWRPVFHQDKEELIQAMDRELSEDSRGAVELLAAHCRQHGRSGQRRQRSARHQDLRRRSEDSRRHWREDSGCDAHGQGCFRSGLVPRYRPAQSGVSLWIAKRRHASASMCADVQDAIETAVGGKAVSQVLAGRTAL